MNLLKITNKKVNQASGGTCSSCGGTIYQSTYADWCDCGESDQAY